MMRNLGIEMSVTCEKKTVLGRLQTNREKHAGLVAEARAGYLEQARDALAKKLQALSEGKLVALSFSLQLPVDYTRVYDLAIRMLSLHQGESVVLGAAEFQRLMEDDWDWTREFAHINAAYSPGTRQWSATKGLEP